MNHPRDWPDIDTALYDRSVKIFSWIRKRLGAKIMLHAESQLEQGDIFLFNHFARFETFIPQYLIYEKIGAYSCAIASGEFFDEDTALSRYLRHVGVFPHDHPRLFPMLAAQILRGRKVIVFPEGGMVKNRRVMDLEGRYSIYSRITGAVRKHHSGPAVLAQGLEAFKATVRNAYFKKDLRQLQIWKEGLQFDRLDQLLFAAFRPTLIVPANITFNPIRSSENLLQRGVELFADKLTPRHMEEVLIEGNLLLKDTDMDVRLGRPIAPCAGSHWWGRYLLELLSVDFRSLDDVFALHLSPGNFRQRLLGRYLRRCVGATRNRYMEEMYANVTVNLSHLASSLIMDCIAQGKDRIDKERLHTALYYAVRQLQKTPGVHLHHSLVNPLDYLDLPDGRGKRFEQFMCLAMEGGLIVEEADHYRFTEKLGTDYDLDTIRLSNPIAVYNNEAMPVRAVRETLLAVLKASEKPDRRRVSDLRMEDERLAVAWEKNHYAGAPYEQVNGHETANADPSPFLLEPEIPRGTGVLLIHGLLAGPAEVRAYGDHLCRQGYTVLGMRLQGHCTSPWALQDQQWEGWYASVRRGFNILRLHCERIVPVGFSTGGALALKLAAECCSEIIGVVALAVPVKINDPIIRFVPLLHGTNQLMNWISSHGAKPFIDNHPENPHINYRSIPVKSLYELQRLIEAMDESLPAVDVPSLVVYADGDPLVSLKSAPMVMDRLGGGPKRLEIISATRHGILTDENAGAWPLIDGFLEDLCAKPPLQRRRGPCFSPLLPSNAAIQCADA